MGAEYGCMTSVTRYANDVAQFQFGNNLLEQVSRQTTTSWQNGGTQ